MSEQIVLYYNPMSRASIALSMLEEAGAPYRLELIDLDKNEQKSPAFLAKNPMGKLPTIEHRGTVVTEAAAVCSYVADAFPKAGLAPALDDPARGTYYRWLFFGAGCIEPAAFDKSAKRPEATPRSIGYGSYDDVLNALEQALKPGPFLLGKQFSAADVYIGAQLSWGIMFKSIEPRPIFQEYSARVSDRPAAKRAMEIGMSYTAKLKSSK